MKTNTFTLIVAMLLIAAQSTIARPQNSFRVEAMRADISENLDLEAVATMFSYAKNLNDFEKRLNDPRAAVSNLDLNDDGYVDYLRVIKETDRYVDIIIIQAVLGADFYQDIATIVVERNRNRGAYIQIVGDVYIYGYDYIIEPVFYWNPPLVDWLWRNTRLTWISPWYWNYYPRYYKYYRPVPAHVYYDRVYHRINHKHLYHYDGYRKLDYRRSNDHYRHDWIDRYPDRRFDKRNNDVKNKKELREKSGNEAVRRSQGAGSRSNDINNSRKQDVNTQINTERRNQDVQRKDIRTNDVQNGTRPVENRVERRNNTSEPVRNIERTTERKVETRIERSTEVKPTQVERRNTEVRSTNERSTEVRRAEPNRKPEVRQTQSERRQEVKSTKESKPREVKEAKPAKEDRNERR